MTKTRSVTPHRTFHSAVVFFALFTGVCVLLSAGCSLIRITSRIEPIPKKEMNVRLSLHDFSSRFAGVVETTADTILAQSNDLEMQLNALRWKIHGFKVVRHAAFHPAPIEALVDTWVLTAQMADFFRVGAGMDVFGEWQGLVIAECDSLQSEIATIALQTRSTKEFLKLQDFVTEEARRYPLADVSMSRRSAVPEWRAYMGIPDSVAVSTVGTLPQVVTHVGARVVTASEHAPKEARWNVELVRKRSRIDSLHLAARLDSLSSLIHRISVIAENSPEILGSSIELLGIELETALKEVDVQRSATLIALAEERAAIVTAFERERMAVLQELDNTVSSVVDKTLGQVKSLVVDSLLIIALLFVFILVAPFVMGHMVGRARARRAETS